MLFLTGTSCICVETYLLLKEVNGTNYYYVLLTLLHVIYLK